MTAVHLFLPALWGGGEFDAAAVALRTPALTRCLAQASLTVAPDGNDATAALFALFGLPTVDDASLPVAAASHWADFPDLSPDAHGGAWLRVDPVHLRPDLGKLLLFDADHLQIDAREARQLVAPLNAHLLAEGLQISFGDSPGRWYLRLPSPARLTTVDPSRINGQHVDPFIARGEDARAWQRRILEWQMLLHQSEVNAAREQRGEPTINSLWPWGGGELPRLARDRFSAVATDDPVALGLCRAAGMPAISGVRPSAELLARGGELLVAANAGQAALARRDPVGWASAIESVDAEIVSPLRTALRRGRLTALHLHGPGGRHTLQRADLWRLWRLLAPPAACRPGDRRPS